MTVETLIKCDRCGKRLETTPQEPHFRLMEYVECSETGRWDLCSACKSAVRACISNMHECSTCNGSGKVDKYTQPNIVEKVECLVCRGTGKASWVP